MREDVACHDWFDIPLGAANTWCYKISVSPTSEGVHFSSEDVEMFCLASQAANARLFRLRTEAAEYRRGFLEAAHETRHAQQSALAGIEVLRRRVESVNEEIEFDNKYILRNLEGSIRLMTFLNEYPNLEDPRGNYSKELTSLHRDVIAPITNLVRHCFLNELLAKDEIAFPRDYESQTIQHEFRSFRELHKHYAKSNINNLFEQMRFLQHDKRYSIYYSDQIKKYSFYINPFRLQCVFYNLLSNSLKYRHEDRVTIVVRVVEDVREFETSEIDIKSYVVVRVSDEGLGFTVDERDEVFEPLTRGSASRISLEPGYGKGLFVARTIMRGLGGDVRLERLRDFTALDVIIPKAASKRQWMDGLRKRDSGGAGVFDSNTLRELT